MSNSPLLSQKTDRISYNVKINGTALKSDYHVVMVEVENNINKLPYATVEILDGDPAKQKFEKLDKLKPKAGDELEIEAGYKEQNKLIFKGIVTAVGLSAEFSSHSRLIIEATDKCRELTLNRKSKFFENKKDSDIVTSILGEYSDITSETDATKTTHKKIVQYSATDWDFILSRAAVSQRVLVVSENKLKFVEPDGSDIANLTFGIDIIDININVDGSNQKKSVSVKGWNPSTHSFKTGKSKEPKFDQQGDGEVKGDKLASNLNAKEEKLAAGTQMDSQELEDYASSRLLFSRLSRVRGNIKMQGYADVKLNSFVELKKIHKNYDGKAYITGVRQTIEQGNFITEVTLGLAPDAFAQNEKESSMADNFGTMPSVKGLLIGTVTKMESDPEGDFRVQVKVPSIDEGDDGLWARLTSPYSGEDGGFIWFPEVGDQVVLGFTMNDPRYPIILGSLYSKKFSPYSDFQPSSGNHKKAIVTRSHLEMSFNDDKKNIQIKTPGGHIFDIKDEGKEIKLKDSHGNFIKMDSSGIEISSIKDIKMSASSGSIDISSLSKIDLSSMKIKLTGKSEVSLSALSSSLKLDTLGFSGSGNKVGLSGNMMASLTAPLVKIN